MEFAGFALIAFAPGAFWLWFFARRDVYRPEPKRLLALTFFLGVVSAVPVAAIEYVFIADSDFAGMAFGTLAANMLFVVGPVEEFSKFLAVRLGGVPLAALRRAGRRAGLRRRRQSGVRVHRKSGLRLGVRSGGDDTPRAAVHRGARGLRRVLGIRARLASGRRQDAERVLGRRRRAAGGVRRSWNVQHSGVRDAARRSRADGARRVVDAVEIRLGAARLAVPIQAQLSQNRLRRLRTAHIRDKPLPPLPPSARRRTPPSRRPLLRTMRRPQQTGRRLLRRLRRQVRSVRKARLETGNQPARGAERQAAGAVMPLANLSRSRIIRIARDKEVAI